MNEKWKVLYNLELVRRRRGAHWDNLHFVKTNCFQSLWSINILYRLRIRVLGLRTSSTKSFSARRSCASDKSSITKWVPVCCFVMLGIICKVKDSLCKANTFNAVPVCMADKSASTKWVPVCCFVMRVYKVNYMARFATRMCLTLSGLLGRIDVSSDKSCHSKSKVSPHVQG